MVTPYAYLAGVLDTRAHEVAAALSAVEQRSTDRDEEVR